MVLERKDLDKISGTKIEDIKKLIENFSILDEKFVNQKYKTIIEVEFNKKKLIKFLNIKNITLSLPKKIDVFFLPVLVDLETNSFNYLNDNIFLKNWEDVHENYFQLNYILPNEDVDDYLIIKNNLKNIENYNFQKILKKYNFNKFIVMIIFKRENTQGLYSSILKTENTNPSSELKFFGEVYICFSFRYFFKTCEIIILQEVFHTLPVIQITKGFVLIK